MRLIFAVIANLVAFLCWLAVEYGPADPDFRILIAGCLVVAPSCGFCFWTAFKKRKFALLIPAVLGLWAILPIIVILFFGLAFGAWH